MRGNERVHANQKKIVFLAINRKINHGNRIHFPKAAKAPKSSNAWNNNNNNNNI
jgi:hypothetical protein